MFYSGVTPKKKLHPVNSAASLVAIHSVGFIIRQDSRNPGHMLSLKAVSAKVAICAQPQVAKDS
jgi:hypothetical protein